MAYRTRIKYPSAQKQEIWDRWKKGESLNSIGRLFDRPSSSIFNILAPTGGIRPPIRSIVKYLNRSPSTISREIKRNGGYDNYRATQADLSAWDRAHRPKRCKLACNRPLSRTVATKLQLNGHQSKSLDGLKSNTLTMEITTCHTKPSTAVYLYKHVACLKKRWVGANNQCGIYQ